MRVLVLGAAGQLGRALGRVLPGEVRLAFRRDADVCDAARLHALVDAVRPDAIVNCAADNRVDRAERDPAAAFAVNDVGAGRVAAAAEHVGALLVHTSTDYVFRGDRPPTGPPYHEEDAPDPAGSYARSKRAASNGCSRAPHGPWWYGPQVSTGPAAHAPRVAASSTAFSPAHEPVSACAWSTTR